MKGTIIDESIIVGRDGQYYRYEPLGGLFSGENVEFQNNGGMATNVVKDGTMATSKKPSSQKPQLSFLEKLKNIFKKSPKAQSLTLNNGGFLSKFSGNKKNIALRENIINQTQDIFNKDSIFDKKETKTANFDALNAVSMRINSDLE